MKNYIQNVKTFFTTGQSRKFWHFCYSWGASLVLIGAMFKLLHFPYANEILMVAMSVEALIFFLSAFDYQPEGTKGAPAHPVHLLPVTEQEKWTIEESDRILSELAQRITSLSEFINSISDASGEIEKQAFSYELQLRDVGRNLQELNQLYQHLLAGYIHRPEEETGREDEIFN